MNTVSPNFNPVWKRLKHHSKNLRLPSPVLPQLQPSQLLALQRRKNMSLLRPSLVTLLCKKDYFSVLSWAVLLSTCESTTGKPSSISLSSKYIVSIIQSFFFYAILLHFGALDAGPLRYLIKFKKLFVMKV
jgi:hypothetical protein